MNIFGMFDVEFFRHMIFGPDLEKDKEFYRKYSEQCKQYQEYLKSGTRPTSMKCVYDDKGRMIWNEATGCCGPATWIEK